MVRLKVLEVKDRRTGRVVLKAGNMGPVNTVLPPEAMQELKRKRQLLRPGIYVDHPGFQIGGKDQEKRRKHRKDYQRAVPTRDARRIRRWRRGRLKIEIEWKLKGSTIEGEESQSLDSDDITDLQNTISRYVEIPGMEETVKQLTEALRKAREPQKTNDDKKRFHPVRSYDQIRHDIRALDLKPLEISQLEECSFEKIIVHVVGGNTKQYEDKKVDNLKDSEWIAIEEFITSICNMEVVDFVTGIKVQESK